MSNMETIVVNGLDPTSVQSAIGRLRQYRTALDRKMSDICMRVAEYGASRASAEYQETDYDTGSRDVTVTAEQTAKGARVHASGENVLFIEYGAGAIKGYGHPRPDGYGPGTFNPNYPTADNPNWSNPKGWIYGGSGSGKSRVPLRTFGNAPTPAMYHAEQAMRDYAETIKGEIK